MNWGTQINMFKISGRRFIAAAAILIGTVIILVALVRPFTERERSAGGLTADLDVTQAAIVKDRQTMHGGASKGPHEYHIVASVFDTASAARVSDATVTAKVWGLGLLGDEAKLEPMKIADAMSYGAFIHLPGADAYAIQLTIKRAGTQQSVILDFTYDHRNQ